MRESADPPSSVRRAVDGEGRGSAAEYREVLEGGFAEGRIRYGPLPLAFAAYAPRVLALTAARKVDLAIAMASVHAADLFLAIACDESVAGAWEALDAELLPRLRPYLVGRRGAATDPAADLAELPGFLFAPPPLGHARTRIGTYDGSGPLLAWLTVVARRRQVERHRRRLAEMAQDVDAADVAAASTTPVAWSIDRETESILGRAFDDVWRQLTAREALVLELSFRDRLSQQQIAALLRIGAPRVSRLVHAAADKLRAGVESRLTADHSPARVRALIRDSLSTFLEAHRQSPRPADDMNPDPPHAKTERRAGS